MLRVATSLSGVVLALALASPATAQAPTEIKLTAGDGTVGDEFGSSVAVSGDTAVIGASSDADANGLSGSAYVFVRSGAGWSQQAKLTAGDGTGGEFFGSSVAVSGDTVLVGAFGNNGAVANSGSVYVFVRSEDGWSQEAKLIASDGRARDRFGAAVALSGDTALIGAPGDNDAVVDSGSVYVFVRSGTSWSQQQKIVAGNAPAFDQFGFSVALDSDMALVGARGADEAGSASGSAYVFVRSGTSWSPQARLLASDGAAHDQFGYSVALSGDTLLVGAPFDDDAGISSGSAYFFVYRGVNGWIQTRKITAGDAHARDVFGFAVALSGDTALVGALANDDAGRSSGSAYAFVRSGTRWSRRQKIVATDAAEFDVFGKFVALSGDTALIGAPQDDDLGFNSGSAYVYTLSPATFRTFGAGCPGNVGTPALAAAPGRLPWIGSTFEIQLSDMPGTPLNAPFGILGLSKTQWGGMSLPQSLAPVGIWNCTQYVSADFVTALVNMGGRATWKIDIPSDSTLIGHPFYVQGLVFDFGINPINVILTNAGEGALGGW